MVRGWRFFRRGYGEPAPQHTWLDVLLHLSRVLVPLSALVVGGWPTLLGVVLIQEVARWAARCLTNGDTTAERLFLAAYAVRAALAIPLHAWRVRTLSSGGLFQDDDTYDRVADALSRVWRGEGTAVFTGHQHLLDSSYAFVLGGLYFVLGHAPLVGKLLSVAVAALCVVLLYIIARDLFGEAAGRVAGGLAVVLPTLVIWSLVELKELPTLCAIVLALRAAQVLGTVPLRSITNAPASLVLVGGLAVVADLRPPIFAILLVLLGVLIGLRTAAGVRPRTALLVAGALCAIALVCVVAVRSVAPTSPLAGATRLDEISRQLAERRGWEAAAARSQISQSAGDTVAELEDIASAFGYALLAPAPWQAHGTRELAASAELLVWYALLALAPVAIRMTGTPAQRRFRLLLALYGLAMWGSLALAEGNLGNLLRHRVMLTPALLVLGAGGAVYAWRALRQSTARRGFAAPPAMPPVSLRGEPAAPRVSRGG